MVKELKEFGVDVYGYDPLISKEEIGDFGVEVLSNLYVKVDCVIVAVAQEEFKKINLDEIKKFMNDKPVIVDVRGMFSEEEAEGMGIYYKTL
jgi:UDPglucose 6-dehydrogenase/UDP-N-acetyl-D-galactosamine dehydrogenase